MHVRERHAARVLVIAVLISLAPIASIAQKPIPMRDVHATVLNLMGLRDDRLTYLHAGRYRRLTDIGGDVLKDIVS